MLYLPQSYHHAATSQAKGGRGREARRARERKAQGAVPPAGQAREGQGDGQQGQVWPAQAPQDKRRLEAWGAPAAMKAVKVISFRH